MCHNFRAHVPQLERSPHTATKIPCATDKSHGAKYINNKIFKRRSHLVHAPASGLYDLQPHDEEGISFMSFYASHQLLLWAQGCTELALVVFLFSLPLKTLSNAYQRINSELGVSAAGSNLVHVSSTHPPSLTGRRAHFKQIQ